MEVVQKYTNDFHDVMNVFNILRPSIEPTATGTSWNKSRRSNKSSPMATPMR